MAENITNNQKFTGIVVDDGSVRESIRNKHGDEIGVFYFRPTDIGIIDRYNKVATEFDKITAPLENVNINADGTVDEKNDAEMNAMREAEQKLFEACDYLFGGNMSEAFFGKMHPFSPVNGRFYLKNCSSSACRKQSAGFTKKLNLTERKWTSWALSPRI